MIDPHDDARSPDPLCVTALETAAYAKLMSLPTGVTVSGLSLVLSILVYVGISVATADE